MLVPQKRKVFSGRQPILSTTSAVLLGFILVGVVVIDNVAKGNIQPVGAPTPTPTRAPQSYILEAQAYFAAGDIQSAIQSYEDALVTDPENVPALTELSRLRIYQSALETNQDKPVILEAALTDINKAVEIDPNDSNAQAVRALVLDWYADLAADLDERGVILTEANQAAINAITLDSDNALAIAYRAEILNDQQQFTQALQLAENAVALEPNIMDTHRVYAYVLESTGNYSKAIEEYKVAASITPNFTYLYIKIGQNYRQLRLYDQALEYFDRAASINETLGIQDPLPFVAIAKTYSRQGEFFIAARNAEKALDFDNQNAELYGELGLIRFRARNYEGSIPVLRCAVEGCTSYWDTVYNTVVVPEETQDIDEDFMIGMDALEVQGLPLNNNTVVFYYTYGSVLAALDRCGEALPILDRVQSVYEGDELIMEILNESYFICS